MSFKLEEIREIVGEAYTDDMGKKLAKLHRTVVDPLLDQLEDAKSDAQRYKAKADKAAELQKQVDELSKGDDWKAKYEAEKKAHDDYKAHVDQEKTTSKANFDNLASVYRMAAAPSPSTEPKFPWPSTRQYLMDQS